MRRAGMILTAVLVFAAAAVAQMQPPKPGLEVKKLDVFVGTWTLSGDMKPGMMGPGGSMTENEKCEWMDGGFYLVCTRTTKAPWVTASACPSWDTPPTTRPIPIASSTASASSRTPKVFSMAIPGHGPAKKRWAP